MCGAILLAALSIPVAAAQPQDTSRVELAIKATYLSKIEPFVDWPQDAFPSPGSTFNLCIVGHDPFGDMLDRASAGLSFGTHPITVLRLPTLAANPPCQIAYLAPDGPDTVAHELQALAGKPILTVTDSASDPASRGIVNFVTLENHVRLEIDIAAAATDRLKISSKLLAVALVKGKS